MHNIYIAGTGIWHPEEKISNEEIVKSYNSYVEKFNNENQTDIENGLIQAMELSSAEFIEKASGIESRYVIDKEGILDINRMMPRVNNEHSDRLSIHAEVGIQAAKKCSELIPLCHPLMLTKVNVELTPNNDKNCIEITATAKLNGRTGVEMEAIMGVNSALITIYDLSKIVNPHLKIDNVKLLIKEGGKSGLWKNPDGLPDFLENIF